MAMLQFWRDMCNLVNDLQKDMKELQIKFQKMILNNLYSSLKNEYNREIYAWKCFEEDCEEWHMDHSNF